MKVYNRVVIDIDTGQTLEEDSYEYDGPVAECKGENKTFKQQQTQSFAGVQNTAGGMNSFITSLNGYMAQRFGEQSQTFGSLSKFLQGPMMAGPGYVGQKSPTGMDSFGRLPSDALPGQPGGGGGGGGGRRGKRVPFGAGDPRVGDTSWLDPNANFTDRAGNFGYDPDIYKNDAQIDPDLYKVKFQPQSFYGDEEAALRTQASEGVSRQYENAAQALGVRSQQLGEYSPGIQAAGEAGLLDQAARAESEQQLGVTMTGAQNLREDTRTLASLEQEAQARQSNDTMMLVQLKADLQKAQAAGLLTASEAAQRWDQGLQQYELGQQQIRGQLEAARIQARGAGASARAGLQAAQLGYRSDMARLAESRRQFNISSTSDNFFRATGAYGQLGGMQDPTGYGNIAGGTYGNLGSMWGGTYGTGSQGMVQTRSNPYLSALAGGIGGGIMGLATGGASFLGSGIAAAGSIASKATG